MDEPNVHQSVLDEIDEHEKILDVVNIRVQRQLAEREAQTSRRKEKKEKSSGGWFGWWKGSEDKKESIEIKPKKKLKYLNCIMYI